MDDLRVVWLKWTVKNETTQTRAAKWKRQPRSEVNIISALRSAFFHQAAVL